MSILGILSCVAGMYPSAPAYMAPPPPYPGPPQNWAAPPAGLSPCLSLYVCIAASV